MPVLNSRKTLPAFPITDVTVAAWLKEELDGSPVVPTRELARECALALLNLKRAETGQEPLKRCPVESADAAMSYIEALVADGVVKARKAPKKTTRDEDEEEDEPVDEDDEELDEDGDEGKSVIKRKYKTRYRPHKMTNGDDIARLVSDHVKVKGEDGKMHVDTEKLEEFARANGCWEDKYRFLNPGMQRMNICNRLRAKVRKDHTVIWN